MRTLSNFQETRIRELLKLSCYAEDFIFLTTRRTQRVDELRPDEAALIIELLKTRCNQSEALRKEIHNTLYAIAQYAPKLLLPSKVIDMGKVNSFLGEETGKELFEQTTEELAETNVALEQLLLKYKERYERQYKKKA